MYDNLRRWLDIDDLLFQKRNKDYGAYQLRKRYNSVVITGIILASLLVSATVVLPFMLTPHSDNVLRGNRSYVQVNMENLEPPKEEIYVPPSPPPPQAVHVEEIVKYVPPEVVDSIPPLEKSQLSTDEYINQTTKEKVDVTGTGAGDDLMPGQYGTETDEPFFLVEVMPSFKGGGLEKFRIWVQNRTSYPQAAIDKKIRGKVYLTFIVEKDGSVSNVTVVKGVDPLLDDEAVKAISDSPKWKPGLQRGEPVRVRYSIPLDFRF
ncbi:MAG: TonB family protein [Bacteroidales bacterium]|jgi:protein TonB